MTKNAKKIILSLIFIVFLSVILLGMNFKFFQQGAGNNSENYQYEEIIEEPQETPEEKAKKESVNAEFAYLDYFDKNLSQRFSGTDMEKEAASYLKSELESFGYSPEIQNFSFDLWGEHHDSQNVIVHKEGISSDYQIILGAHYDSVQTAGIGDNASGVSLMLTYAKNIAKENPMYNIDIAFFGSEELGMEGSKAYVKNMTQEELDKTIVMINADVLLVGTYRYVYGGTVDVNSQVKDAWGAYLAKEISDSMGLGLRFNDTPVSTYTSPTGVEHSDHASFQNAGIPYIYFEATNWELPDDPQNPEKGSTGDYETEIGRFMHNPARDNLTFINQQYEERARENISAYTVLLPKLVEQICTRQSKGEISDSYYTVKDAA